MPYQADAETQASSLVTTEVQTETVAPQMAEAISQMRDGVNGTCQMMMMMRRQWPMLFVF